GDGWALRTTSSNTGQLELEIGTLSTDYATQVVADGPIAFLKLDESAGPTAADSSGASFCSGSPCDGTYGGGVNYEMTGSTRDGSTSIEFSTNSGNVELPADLSFTDGLGNDEPFTFEAWIKPTGMQA